MNDMKVTWIRDNANTSGHTVVQTGKLLVKGDLMHGNPPAEIFGDLCHIRYG